MNYIAYEEQKKWYYNQIDYNTTMIKINKQKLEKYKEMKKFCTNVINHTSYILIKTNNCNEQLGDALSNVGNAIDGEATKPLVNTLKSLLESDLKSTIWQLNSKCYENINQYNLKIDELNNIILQEQHNITLYTQKLNELKNDNI